MGKRIQLIIISVFLIVIIIYPKKHTKNFTTLPPKKLPSNGDYIRCLLNVHTALKSLSIPWFLTFGTALSYWRSKNFISHDIDIGLFIDDLDRQGITDEQLVSTMTMKLNFTFRRRFGQMNHGQEWAFTCPQSNISLDIFVFYPLNQSNYWAATYTGLCERMQYRKCRWTFRKFRLKLFRMFKKLFYIVPLTFIKERYGKNYMIKRDYGYDESLTFLPNLIEEYAKNFSRPTSSSRRRKVSFDDYFLLMSLVFFQIRF